MVVRAVSFDLDGTLVDLASFDDVFWFRRMPELYGRRHGMDPAAAKEEVLARYRARPKDADWYSPRFWFGEFDLRDDLDSVLGAMAGLVRVFPDAVRALDAISGRMPLALVTHTSRDFLPHKLAGPLGSRFSVVISTIDDLGCKKDRPDVFALAASRLGAAPSDVVHVGDHPVYDYHAPRKAGMRALYLDRGSVTESIALEMEDVQAAAPAVEDTIRSLDELGERLKRPSLDADAGWQR